MKREDVLSTFVYLIMLVIVGLVGFFVLQDNTRYIIQSLGGSTNNIYGFVILSIVISVILNVVLLEVGHALGGKMGNYSIFSINIMGLCFYKEYNQEQQKLCFKFGFKSFDGLAGETKITPKENKECSPNWYMLMPFVIFLLEVVALVIAYTFINNDSALAWFKYFLVILVTIGGVIALYNYIPVKLDSTTDGFRYTFLNKKVNVEAFNKYLKLQEELALGKEDIVYPYFEELTDYTANINLLSLYEHIEKGEIDKCYEVVEKIITSEEKIRSTTKAKALIWKLYLLLKEGKLDEAKELHDSFDDDQKDVFKKDKSLGVLKTYIYYLGLIEKTDVIVEEAEIKFLRVYKNEISPFKENEKKLFDEIVKELELNKQNKKEN